MTQPKSETPVAVDKWIQKFLAHLATDRGASIYTRRNYRQALLECERWHREERGQPPRWDALLRDDFRNYVRYLGRRNLSRAAIQLRFCALRSFYKFLIRHGEVTGLIIERGVCPLQMKRNRVMNSRTDVRDLQMFRQTLTITRADDIEVIHGA